MSERKQSVTTQYQKKLQLNSKKGKQLKIFDTDSMRERADGRPIGKMTKILKITCTTSHFLKIFLHICAVPSESKSTKRGMSENTFKNQSLRTVDKITQTLTDNACITMSCHILSRKNLQSKLKKPWWFRSNTCQPLHCHTMVWHHEQKDESVQRKLMTTYGIITFKGPNWWHVPQMIYDTNKTNKKQLERIFLW